MEDEQNTVEEQTAGETPAPTAEPVAETTVETVAEPVAETVAEPVAEAIPAADDTTSGDIAVDASAAAEPGVYVSHQKVRIGVVVSNKMQKSIVVAVERRVRHKLYKKYFNKTNKFMAHDENNECSVGDTVRIVETRPLSARKHWRLDTILEKVK